MISISERTRFLEYVKKHHSGQFDSQGAPFWLHPYRVAMEAESFLLEMYPDINPDSESVDFYEGPIGEDPFEKIYLVGIYHDVIEDCPGAHLDVLVELEEYPEIVRSILILTNPKHWPDITKDFLSEQEMYVLRSAGTYTEWIEAIIGIGDPFAIIIKYMDNLDNSLRWRSKVPGKPNLKYVQSKKILENYLNDFFFSDSDISEKQEIHSLHSFQA